jgi:hypothetical protein
MNDQNIWETDENWEYNPENTASYGYNNPMSGFSPQQQAPQQENPTLPTYQQQTAPIGSTDGLASLPGLGGTTTTTNNNPHNLQPENLSRNKHRLESFLQNTPDYMSTMDAYRNQLSNDFGITNYQNPFGATNMHQNLNTREKIYTEAQRYLNGVGAGKPLGNYAKMGSMLSPNNSDRLRAMLNHKLGFTQGNIIGQHIIY